MVALTLLETAKLAANRGEVKRAAVIQTFRRESDLLATLPFLPIAGSAYAYNIEQTLPGIAFRGINEAWTPSAGILSNDSEPLKIGGGDLDVDVALIKMHGMQVRTTHEQLKTKALARQIGYDLIEGDPTSDKGRSMGGLKWRVPTTGSQALALASAGALSMKALDELIEKVDDPTHLLMNRATRRNITAYLRSGGSGAASIEMSRDEFGRPVSSYNGLPILISDRNGELAALPFTEASSTSSLFVLSIGLGTYHGIQNGEMDVRDLGELNSPPAYRTRVEWLLAQAIVHPRAVARGHNFTNATAVA